MSLSIPFVALLIGALIVVASASTLPSRTKSPRILIAEVGEFAWKYNTTRCDPSVLGSIEACFDADVPAVGNFDYPWGHPRINYPKDGSPWGAHLTGPSADGVTYILTWYTGNATVSPNATLPPASVLKRIPAIAELKAKWGSRGSFRPKRFSGTTIQYLRNYTSPNPANAEFNYLSPYIHNVVLKNLLPSTQYNYKISATNGSLFGKFTFTTLSRKKSYPLRIGVIGDVGQTANSTDTRNHLYDSNPQVILHVGDSSYADDYSAYSPDDPSWDGSNQNRWDSHAHLWEKMFAKAPLLNVVGNHDVEDYGIGAVVDYTTTNFSYPENYPFQAYAARFPAPGVRKNFGDITQSLYYSTIVGGAVKVIALNNYVPFHPGTPQYNWVMQELKTRDRKKTPWLIVMYHSATYHSYFVHFKEMECFLSIYEEAFYKYGVDFVFNGHVHAYERTHPVYKYKPNSCGPIYMTVGDGGNIEGPYRNFVDEVNPATNKTYCEQLKYGGRGPNAMQDENPTGWGPYYQRVAFPPGCPTLSWQAAASVGGGPILVPRDGSPDLGFCQSSQPAWSAHRDPSFGHGILELLSDSEARFHWYKNMEGNRVLGDSVLLHRSPACRLLDQDAR